MSFIERLVSLCCRHAWAVILVSLLLGVGGCLYTQQNFALNTDSESLISAKIGWRMRQARFDAAFPQHTNLTVAVIDGRTPELAEAAAAALTAKRKTTHGLFTDINRPDGGARFALHVPPALIRPVVVPA